MKAPKFQSTAHAIPKQCLQAAELYDSLIDKQRLRQFDVRAVSNIPEGPIQEVRPTPGQGSVASSAG